MSLEELLDDQGEVALSFIFEDNKIEIEGYKLPEKNNFESVELAEAFVLASKSDFEEVTALLASSARIEEIEKGLSGENPLINDNSETPYGNPENLTSLEPASVFGKYKPVHLKVRPQLAPMPEEFRVQRNITGDPLAELPELSPNPPEYSPGERYTLERKEVIDKNHSEDFLWPEERKLLHHFMTVQEKGFAWCAEEGGNFRTDFFPPIKFPVLPHTPWVEKNIPIPPGIYEEVCKILKDKIAAGVYEPTTSSYRSRWFMVLKKDGKSLRLVHSLEALNRVTIQHSGIPPGTAEIASSFSGRACLGMLDIWVGYDERLIDEKSRDYTTFQTPFGPYRLVKLPMGWTNSVPLFHEDVSYIFREEMPHVTRPYIDDVPIRGPASRYETPDGSFETIPENKGIRRFVWEHFQNVNRIVQRMKYVGGTFSGPKAYLCVSEGLVVGHRVSYEGEKPVEKLAEVILSWDPANFENRTHIKSFLGTAGQMRMFIKDYAKITRPLTKLTAANVPFVIGEAEMKAVRTVQEAIQNAPALKPIDYENPNGITLAVDTSWQAVGFYLYQEDPENPRRKFFNYFGSITLNEREARFSQPKRELYGLMMALRATKYQTYGCRNLTVETDASYIKGMLDNPSSAPNASINRWIEEIRLWRFTLVHIKGLVHGPDGLSRPPPGGKSTERPEGWEEFLEDDDGKPVKFRMGENQTEEPLEFETFKDHIDPRSGYFNEVVDFTELATNVVDFEEELQEVRDEERLWAYYFESFHYKKESWARSYSLKEVVVIPSEIDLEWSRDHPYDEIHRSQEAIDQDEGIPKIIDWLVNSDSDVLKLMTASEKSKFIRRAAKFFVDNEGRLYRKSLDGSSHHRLFVPKEKRMWMLVASHDNLGHKGMFATKALIEKRFWWPHLEEDVDWFVKSCKPCQERKLELLRIPPVLTHTPSLFQKIHIDVIKMTPASRGCKNIVHGRCALSNWSEARGIANENARQLAEWFFDDILCRWGTPEEIVTDNAPQMLALTKWLRDKYGVRGIRISPYNSQANGKIERAHFDIRQALAKATSGNLHHWFYFLKHILWADRITTRKSLGCSPYFFVLGAEPILPLDLVESTWLVKTPERVWTREELIGFRAQALAKHRTHVLDMVQRVSENKRRNLRKFEQDYMHTIKPYDLKPGTLVQVRNTQIEKNLDRKMFPRYLGPCIVIRRTKGGSYILAEMDGTLMRGKYAAFRVLPHVARYTPIELPSEIEKLIHLSKEKLDKLVEEDEEVEYGPDKDYIFDRIPNLRLSEEEADIGHNFEEVEESDVED